MPPRGRMRFRSSAGACVSPISACADAQARNLLQRGSLRAPAVQAAVPGARPADELELVAERSPRPVQAHSSVVGSDAFFAGNLGNARAVEVHPAEEARVGRLEDLGQRGDAVTDRLLQLLLFCSGTGGPSLAPRPLLACCPPTRVADCMTEEPGEPSDAARLVADGSGAF